MPTEPEVIERISEYFGWLEHELGGVVFDRTQTRQSEPRRHRGLLLAAATVVIVIAVLAITPRWRGQDPPVASIPTPSTTVSPVRGSPRPALYPAFPDEPRFEGAQGVYGGRSANEVAPIATALVAKLDGDAMVDPVWIRVFAEPPVATFAGSRSESVAIDGVEYEQITDTGFRLDHVPVITLLRHGTPTVAVTALDPVAVVEAVGVPVTSATVSYDGKPEFAVGALPDGYEVVVAPVTPPVSSWGPQLSVPGDGERPWVEVTLDVPLPFLAIAEDLRAVDVNGVRGWINSSNAWVLMWPLDDGSWATVVDFTPEGAIALARSIELVDETTWQTEYLADDDGLFEIQPGPPPDVTPVTTLPVTTAPFTTAPVSSGR